MIINLLSEILGHRIELAEFKLKLFAWVIEGLQAGKFTLLFPGDMAGFDNTAFGVGYVAQFSVLHNV